MLKLNKFYFVIFFLLFSFSKSFSNTKNLDDLKMLLESEKNTIKIFQESVQSVVNITNIRAGQSHWPFGQRQERRSGIGSGFVWDQGGHIVTNSHVVSSGDSFLVSFHKDKKQYKAKLVGAEPNKDIAVLKLLDKPLSLKSLNIGSSSTLLVGQKTLAIGSPYGLDHSMTSGIISALKRVIEGFGGVTIKGVIQTDASINPGNSGGPLLNSQGKLIGMNTSIVSTSGASAGLGFAVPVDTIKRVVPQLIKYGKIIRPGLGIGIEENYTGKGKGLIVLYTQEGGAAEKAGLRGVRQDAYGKRYLGDIILKINGKETNSYNDIYHVLDNHKVGDTIEVTFLRNSKIHKIQVKLTPLSY
ncbi:trypsin-like peptidase domain-containing protein [Bacteriovoracales bacterium]|nr:trypsin-like peptidase domain-containing protein [Bacteriovoracales bacterium]